MADPVKIDIVTTADTTGAKQTAAAINQVTDATKKGGQASKETAKNVNDLGENFEKGAAASRAFGSILRGDILGGLSQLAPVIKGIGAALRANLLGILITIGAALFAFFRDWKKGMADTAKATDEMAKRVDAARESAKELGEQKVENLKAELELAAGAAKDLLDNLTAATREAQKVDDLQRAVELARIEDDASLTPAEKARRSAQVNQRYDARRVSRALDPFELAVRAAEEQRDTTQAAEGYAARDAGAANDRAEADKRLRQQTDEQIKQITDTLSRSIQETAGAAVRGEIDETTRQLRDADATSAADAALVPLLARQGALNSEGGLAKQARLVEEQAAANKALDVANAAAIASAERLAKAEADLARERATQEKLAPLRAELNAREQDRTVRGAAAGQLENVAAMAPGLGALAGQGLASPIIAANPQLRAAATALQSAAKAAQEGGSTSEEALALADAALALLDAVKKVNLKSDTLAKKLADIQGQVKGLR